jgi:opacity protein-like surface antigen
MRKLAIALATAAAVTASPAVARDGAWYVGGEFGAMIVEDTDVDIGATDNALRLSHDYGYDGGLFVGYDLGAFRIEAEAAYKKADVNDFTVATGFVLPAAGPNFFTAGTRDAGGSASALSFMINGMLDFGDDDGLSGFVGAGAGMARVKYNSVRGFANTGEFLDDSDSRLAWQVFAGVRQAITDNIDVSVKYRWFNVEDVEMATATGLATNNRWRSHSLLGGVTFNFGAPEPPPPPPVVRPAPPPAPAPIPAPVQQMRTCPPNNVQVPANQPCPVPPAPPVPRTGENG